MIHEIFPHSLSNEYLPDTIINDGDYILHYHHNRVLLKKRGDFVEIPKKKDFSQINDKSQHIFLFSFDDVPCFLRWDTENLEGSELTYTEISFFRTASQQEVAWITLVGYHLMNWYLQNKFCGKCGVEMHQRKGERALECPDCNSAVFPKIAPAIIVAIVCKDKILLARSSRFPGSWYSLIAGYVDVGESLEETVVREVKEEVGLDVKNIRYYKSQPWPLSGSMMIGFIAEADEHQPVFIDGDEITEAAWFSRGSLPNHSLNLSIAGEMIEKFDRGEL